MRFRCPNCRRMLDALEGTAGRKARCPSCKVVIIVPHLTPDISHRSFESPPTETSDPPSEEKEGTT